MAVLILDSHVQGSSATRPYLIRTSSSGPYVAILLLVLDIEVSDFLRLPFRRTQGGSTWVGKGRPLESSV